MQQREADLKGRRQVAALVEIEADFENVRTAWLWALHQKSYTAINQMVDSLSLFCEMRGRFAEGMDLCWQAQMQVAADPPDALPLIWGRVFTHWVYITSGASHNENSAMLSLKASLGCNCQNRWSRTLNIAAV